MPPTWMSLTLLEGSSQDQSTVKKSIPFDLEGPIIEDVCRLDRFVLDGVDVNIKLYRQNPSFCLMFAEEDPNYKIVLDDVIFRVCRIQVSPGIIVGHNKTLETTTAKYPLINTDVKLASIASGQTRFIWDNIYLTQCPSKIVVGLVSTEAQTGNYRKNSFNFQTFGARQVGTVYLSTTLVYQGNLLKSKRTTAIFLLTAAYLTLSIKLKSIPAITLTEMIGLMGIVCSDFLCNLSLEQRNLIFNQPCKRAARNCVRTGFGRNSFLYFVRGISFLF